MQEPGDCYEGTWHARDMGNTARAPCNALTGSNTDPLGREDWSYTNMHAAKRSLEVLEASLRVAGSSSTAIGAAARRREPAPQQVPPDPPHGQEGEEQQRCPAPQQDPCQPGWKSSAMYTTWKASGVLHGEVCMGTLLSSASRWRKLTDPPQAVEEGQDYVSAALPCALSPPSPQQQLLPRHLASALLLQRSTVMPCPHITAPHSSVTRKYCAAR